MVLYKTSSSGNGELIRSNMFSKLLDERTRRFSNLSMRNRFPELVKFGFKYQIYPLMISYHLPEIIGNRNPIRLLRKGFYWLTDSLLPINELDHFNDFHTEYWFHIYQVYDYYSLLNLWDIKDSPLFKLSLKFLSLKFW